LRDIGKFGWQNWSVGGGNWWMIRSRSNQEGQTSRDARYVTSCVFYDTVDELLDTRHGAIDLRMITPGTIDMPKAHKIAALEDMVSFP
jgi:hypothetical protein